MKSKRPTQTAAVPLAKTRRRPTVAMTLSLEAIEMGRAVAKREGSSLSRIVERMIRNAFHEYELELPVKKK